MRAPYSLVELTQPVVEPVTLALVKNHLAVDHSDDDAAITADITAARLLCEKHTGVYFGSRTLRFMLTEWPNDGIIRLPDGVTAITSVTYSDTLGSPQVIASANWRLWLDGTPPQLSFLSSFALPSLELNNPAAITILLTAGDTSNNALVSPAIKLTVGYWRKFFGGEDSSGHLSRGLPAGAINILDKIWTGAL